jgi:predicted unusual protein kinase regulating ubiquinone biosynthesis (AarF/ABC1/UbiB family)
MIGYAGLVRHARKLHQGNDKAVRDAGRRHVVARLGKLRGLPQKIGQMGSMRLEGDEFAAYQPLTDSSQPLPWKRMRKVLQKAWRCRPEKHLRWVDPEGFGASLGQVHRAELHDGRTVAVKIRYPGIRQAVMADLKVLGWIAGRALGMPKDADFSGIRDAILQNLEEELDYRIEAEHQRRYRVLARDMPRWVIPQIVDELSGEQVLTSVWESGERIESVSAWPQDERQQIADELIGGFAHMLFAHGLVHADPHPGNYRFARTGGRYRIVLYDFGSMVSVSAEHRVALLKLLDAATRRAGDPYPELIALGFPAEVLAPFRPMLPAICWTLFEPVWQPGKQPLAWGRFGEQAGSPAGNGMAKLWTAMPAHLIFIRRALNGLRCYVERLGATVQWGPVLAPWLAKHGLPSDGQRS